SGKSLHTVSLGSRPSSLAVAAGRVWVASLENRTITRIDAESGKVVDVLGVDGTPTAIAGGAGAVWVTDGIGGYLLRLDPRSGRAMSSRPDGPAEVILGGHPAALA